MSNEHNNAGTVDIDALFEDFGYAYHLEYEGISWKDDSAKRKAAIIEALTPPAAAPAPAVPQGWKWVPVEPTPDMEGAGRVNMAYGSCTARQVWSAMLTAAPSAPSQPVTAALRDLVAAVQKEMSPDWICSSYHPHLHSALDTAIAAMREKEGK